jgi:hypothetical protein
MTGRRTEQTDQGAQYLALELEPITAADRLRLAVNAPASARPAKPFSDTPLGDVTGRKQTTLF